MHLLDTNHCSRLLQGHPAMIHKLRQLGETPLATCVIVQGELIFMAQKSEQKAENLHQVHQFLNDILVYPPEFPTGNGQIDLIIVYRRTRYGVELKSFTNERDYDEALKQAAQYGARLTLPEITLISFVESVNEEIRARYEQVYTDGETGVKVLPVLVETNF